MLARIQSIFRNLLHEETVERNLDEELRSSLEILTEEKMQSGLSPAAARREALIELGGLEQVKEEVRERRAGNLLAGFGRDLRYGVRVLRRSPGFTLAAVLTIALGIGANSAVFSVVDPVLLRPLPYPDPSQLVQLWLNSNSIPYVLSGPEYFDYRECQRSLEKFAVYQVHNGNLTSHGEALRVAAAVVSIEFFAVLGVDAVLGRTFIPGEECVGVGQVAILSHRFWKNRFGGDPAILRKVITVDGQFMTVVGIMPQDFAFPAESVDMWVPIGFDRANPGPRTSHSLLAIGRIKSDRSFAQASEDISRVAVQLKGEYPDAYPSQWPWDVRLESLHGATVGKVRPALLILFGAVGLVLLIACANVANLLLTRGSVRQREIAIRAALGAGRWRVVRQLLTESIFLSCVGGLLGVGIAVWSLQVLIAAGATQIPRLQEITLDARILCFTVGLSVLSGIIFGLAPALHAVPNNLEPFLKECVRSCQSAGRARFRSALVVCQLSLSLILLIGAGLLTKSFIGLVQIDPGYKVANVLTFSLATQPPAYAQPAQRVAFFERLLDRLRSLPGVQAAGAISHLPLSENFSRGLLMAEGMPRNFPQYPNPWGLVNAGWYSATPDYFAALRIGLLHGRPFQDTDTANAPLVLIVDEEFAKRAWPNEPNPLGRHVAVALTHGAPYEWRTVVGIVRHVRDRSLDRQAPPQAYFPFTQMPFGSLFVAARTTGDPADLAAAVRGEVRSLDTALPVFDVQTMSERFTRATAPARFTASLMTAFGLLAVGLGVLGLSGVVAYAVNQRVHEIGIRMALGARQGEVLLPILRQGLRLTLLGLVVGLGGAFALSRLMRGVLFGVSTTDAATFVTASLSWLIVAALACYIPAWRALKVDPMTVLRHE